MLIERTKHSNGAIFMKKKKISSALYGSVLDLLNDDCNARCLIELEKGVFCPL